ncbi:hypothetical protein F5B20DRAFT_201562 [Whalleya microplaca]|nr:hypothetical protein F5B20DRAFT_201562 [Whalleya microplaca]
MSTSSEANPTDHHDHLQHTNDIHGQRQQVESNVDSIFSPLYNIALHDSNEGPTTGSYREKNLGHENHYELGVPQQQARDAERRSSDYDSLLMFSPNGLGTEGPSKDNEKRSKRNGAWRRHFKFWKWEVGACFLSLASIASVIAVLYVENDKPLDQWAWSIGPTAVVAFITTIAKSSMLLAVSEVLGQLKWLHFYGETNPLTDLGVFDAAGRGPWGAAELLLRKNVKALLASLAAVVTIAALLIDPFMQLVFTFPALSRYESDVYGFFNQTQLYDPNGNTYDSHMTAFAASSVDAQMQAAVIRAVSEHSNSPAATCSTGNCTWPQVTTLGICAQCTDITQQVNTSCPGPTTANHGQYQCDYGMPSGRNLSGFGFKAGATGDFFPTRWNSSATSASASTSGNSSAAAALTYIEAVQLKENYDYGTADISSVLRAPTAWTCMFVLCAKTYEILSMTNGEVSVSEPVEDLLIRTDNITQVDAPIGGGLSGLSTIQGLRVNSSSSSTSTHFINSADFANLGNYLTELFSTGWGARGFGASNRIAQATAPNLGWALSEAENLNQTVRNIAESMTEIIRNSRNSTAIAGQAFRTRTYIEVQWGWVALPLTLTILSLLLIMLMVIRTNRSDLPLWKNSSIALLFHRVDGWAPEGEALQSPSALEKEVRGVSIMLPKDSQDLTFVKN